MDARGRVLLYDGYPVDRLIEVSILAGFDVIWWAGVSAGL
jgi:hypothetical protein